MRQTGHMHQNLKSISKFMGGGALMSIRLVIHTSRMKGAERYLQVLEQHMLTSR